jgi:uncharacterized membrane protein YphA (DoxX/SURF4 family)
MTLKPADIFSVIARIAVGGTLLYAGFMKAAGPAAEFAAVLEAYKLFPTALLTPLSIGVPYAEMWIGLFVLTGFYTRPAALLSALFFTAFLVVIGSALVRHIDLASCGCFGADAVSPRHTLVLDAAGLVLSLTLFKHARRSLPLSLDRLIPSV